MRHGLMLQMASDLGKLGAIANRHPPERQSCGQSSRSYCGFCISDPHDSFPHTDSDALPIIWINSDDFATMIADMNKAAVFMVDAAGKDAGSIKGVMATMGGACSACRKAYRQTES